MCQAEISDRSAADFAAGCAEGGIHVSGARSGGVFLAPHLLGEFTGHSLPAGWSVTPWVDGGRGTLGDGMLTLDGARVGCDALLLSPRSLEVSAIIAPRPDQHLGLGTNFVEEPWVMFSTKWGRRLYGRTHLLSVQDKKLPGHWFGEPHRLRIDWNVLDVVFSIDGIRMAQLMVPMPGHMRALACNQRLGTEPLRVEWMRLSPYAPSGRFTSRVLDGRALVEWQSASWDAEVPDATSLTMEVRTGDVDRPDATWSPWRSMSCSGHPVAATSRYLQYRAALATADPAWTPVLRSFRVDYSAAGDSSSSSRGSGRTLGCQ